MGYDPLSYPSYTCTTINFAGSIPARIWEYFPLLKHRDVPPSPRASLWVTDPFSFWIHNESPSRIPHLRVSNLIDLAL